MIDVTPITTPDARNGNAAIIVHVDVDAFFASIEQLLIPALRGHPVIVGSGVIASCSYEARKFGLRAGMPLRRAKQLCPQVEILEGNSRTYHCFAERIWQVLQRQCTQLETHLDEAYGRPGPYNDPLTFGHMLQRQILDEVGLWVSVGLGANRMMAKLASSAAKPKGVRYIPPDAAADFLCDLPIEKLYGVGRKTAQRLRDMSIERIGQLRSLERSLLREMFGVRGEQLFERCRGRDYEPLRPDAGPKTISRETTFHAPTTDADEIAGMLFYLLERATRAVRAQSLQTGFVELSIRYDDWRQLSASRALPAATDSEDEIFAVVLSLLDRLHKRRVALRHVGLVLSRLEPAASQPILFEADRSRRSSKLQRTKDMIRDRYGHAALVSGRSIELMGKLQQNDYGFVLRTPSLTK